MQVSNRQRGGKRWHDQCHYYDRGERFTHYISMNLSSAIKAAKNDQAELKRCTHWEYDRSVRWQNFLKLVISYSY